jgi:hypothetical protein
MKTIEAGKTGIVSKWDVLEIETKGFDDKNPFVDYRISGTFTGKNESISAQGFYDGGGVYKVRFMPSFEGEYRYEINGSFGETVSGGFMVTAPDKNNHGPVCVAGKYHFAYADKSPYYPIGTTCYAWTHQPGEWQKQTLEELKKGYFNKIRFCVFPKHYPFNEREPEVYPYEGEPITNWDFKRFNPEYFRRFEKRIQDLAELGIEADIIVMHPYDHWGFADMGAENDDLYWKYVVARFAAFRNVWWSFANEFDLMENKTTEDWERYAKIICENDPYNRLRSIHNGRIFYDHNKPWVTHCSIQRQEGEMAPVWREQYQKPVVFDEMCYEGNIIHGWGNISARELVYRFWQAAVYGGYGGHGETYMHPEDILWWSHGKKLHGESPERIKFLLNLMYETPGLGLKQFKSEEMFQNDSAAVPENTQKDYYLIYLGKQTPTFREYNLDENTDYEIELIDTWEMTIKKIGVTRGKTRIELPGKEYMAIRIRGIE